MSSDSDYSCSQSESESDYGSYHSSEYTSDSDSGSKKRTQTKKPKKPRKKTAYLIFCDKERPKIKREHPTWSGSKLMVELGKRWRKQVKK